jgi:hypothetical protein
LLLHGFLPFFLLFSSSLFLVNFNTTVQNAFHVLTPDGLKGDEFDPLKSNIWVYYPIKKSSFNKTTEFIGPNLIITFPSKRVSDSCDESSRSSTENDSGKKVSKGENGKGSTSDGEEDDDEEDDKIPMIYEQPHSRGAGRVKNKGLHFGGKGYPVRGFDAVVITHGADPSRK